MAEPVQRLLAVSDVEKVVDQVLCSRRLRQGIFGTDLFSDPAWDIVLTLFLAEFRREPVAVTELEKATGLSAKASERWLEALAQEGLVQHSPDPFDPDVLLVSLSPRGSSGMRRWLNQWLNCSCPPSTNGRVVNLLHRLTDAGA